MQTFLPYPVYEESAKVLDYRRLGKQRVEAKQLIMALDGETKAWRNHPATIMWEKDRDSLVCYGWFITKEWIRRGYKDSLLPWFQERLSADISFGPKWLGDESFHASHRSNLLRKDPIYYSQFGWKEPPDLPYIWPKGEK